MAKIAINLENNYILKVSLNFLNSDVVLYGSRGECKRLRNTINMHSRITFASLFELAIPNNQERGILHIIYLLFSILSCYEYKLLPILKLLRCLGLY